MMALSKNSCEYFTAAEAALCLGITPENARKILGKNDSVISTYRHKKVMVWLKSKVEKITAQRLAKGTKKHSKSKNYAPKKESSAVGKSYRFELDEFGNVVPLKPSSAGKKCRFEGCDNPVPSGYLYCDSHSGEIRKLNKNVIGLDENMIHSCHN